MKENKENRIAFCTLCNFVRRDIESDYEKQLLDEGKLRCICGGEYVRLLKTWKVKEK